MVSGVFGMSSSGSVVPPEFAPRGVYIRHTDLETWRCTREPSKMHADEGGHEAAGVPHAGACRDRVECAMGDVRDQRLASAEERIT